MRTNGQQQGQHSKDVAGHYRLNSAQYERSNTSHPFRCSHLKTLKNINTGWCEPAVVPPHMAEDADLRAASSLSNPTVAGSKNVVGTASGTTTSFDRGTY